MKVKVRIYCDTKGDHPEMSGREAKRMGLADWKEGFLRLEVEASDEEHALMKVSGAVQALCESE